MKSKKGQGLPLRALIRILLALTVGLIIFWVISAGWFNDIKDIWSGNIDQQISGDEASGDYILRAVLEEQPNSSVLLTFKPNEGTCEELRESRTFVVSYASSEDEYIPDNEFEEEESFQKGNCRSEYDATIPIDETDQIKNRKVRIDVYSQENEIVENIDLEVRFWNFMLVHYLNENLGKLSTSFNGYNALRWSVIMHEDRTPTALNDHPLDQSMDLNEGHMDDVQDLLGMASRDDIEDISDIRQGTFANFLSKLACTYEDGNEDDIDTKERALQVMVTALFADLQDFDDITGLDETSGQPVYRVRDGIGPRGYDNGKGYEEQLAPSQLIIEYPDDVISRPLRASIRGYYNYNAVRRGYGRMNDPLAAGSETVKSSSATLQGEDCLSGKEISVTLMACESCVTE